MPKFLMKTNDIVLLNVRPGKPDHNIPIDLNELHDTRPRVKLAPQKGNACWFYALKILHGGLGKYPPLGYERQRTNEKAFSTRRKRLNQLDEQYGLGKTVIETLKEQVNTLNIPFSEVSNPTVIQGFLTSGFFSRQMDFDTQLKALLNEFCNQTEHSDIEAFVNHWHIKQRNIANISLLKELNLDITTLYEDDVKASGVVNPTSWDKLPEKEKQPYLDNFAYRACYKSLGFNESDWHPNAAFSSLFQNLCLQGPIIVSGLFGGVYYEDPSFQLSQKIAGKTIWGWKPDNKKICRDQLRFHNVVLIGARRGLNDKSYVYFIDPKDGSDPNNIEQQRIYIISYENLIKNITNVRGEMLFMPDGSKRFHKPEDHYGCTYRP